MKRQPCVYMLASKRNGTLYTGVTSNIVKRVWEHKNHVIEGFTKKYNVTNLVWYEVQGRCTLHSTGFQFRRGNLPLSLNFPSTFI